MTGELYVGTDLKEFQKVLEAHTDKNVETDRTSRIISKYSSKYCIDGELTTILGKQIHVDYLPTIDELLQAKDRYLNPKDVVGSAFFKIEKDECLFLTDSRDLNLQRVYDTHQKEADDLANKLLRMNTTEFGYQFTHVLASVLSGSFATVFNQTYGDWRKSLAERSLNNISANN